MQPLSRPLARLRPRYDVVVVGSGYGGGVAASRLARCGRSVCVLERGKEFPTGSFPERFPDLRRELRISGKTVSTGPRDALFQVNVGRDIHVLTGCGVGGGSLVNAAVAMRPDDRVFAHEAWPDKIAGDPALEEGFARAERMLRPARYDGSGSLRKYQALESAGRALGTAPHHAPVVLSFQENTNPAGVRQPACTLCGDCCSGCNVGAKNTVALTYLPDAVRHGAEIFAGAEARDVARTPQGWRITVRPTSGDGEDTVMVEAAIVVLAAGTLGSTAVLLRSREAGLALSDRLGMGFSANGDIIAFGYGASEKVNAIGVGHPPKAEIETIGPCVAGQIRLGNGEALDHEMYLQEGVMPSPLAPLLPVAFIPGGRLLGAAQSLIRGVYNGPFANLHTFFVVSHDSARGRIVARNGGVDIDWPEVAEEDVYARVDAVLKRAVEANGATYVKNPLAGTMMGRQPATAHPLGGCGMGREAADGTVDAQCRVFDPASGSDAVHDGLYVCDGSIMPRSLGVNPLLTIAGLTERAMIHLARERGWRFDDKAISG